MRGSSGRASCNSTTVGPNAAHVGPPALISPSRFSLRSHGENRAGQLLSQERAREAIDTEAPFPSSPLSLREGGWRSCRSAVWRQLCQPGESRARRARGGGAPPASANAMRGSSGGAWCNSTTVGPNTAEVGPPALISPSRFSLRSHGENRAGQLLSQKRAREAISTEAPFSSSPLSLREGGRRSCRSEVWRQLCQPGESRARRARGGGGPPASANAMRGSSGRASCNSTTVGPNAAHVGPPALISPSRFSLRSHGENRAGQLLSQERAREAIDTEAPFPSSPLSLREGGWRSCRSAVWRQLCQPGESRARRARGGGAPSMLRSESATLRTSRPNPRPLPFREGESEIRNQSRSLPLSTSLVCCAP